MELSLILISLIRIEIEQLSSLGSREMWKMIRWISVHNQAVHWKGLNLFENREEMIEHRCSEDFIQKIIDPLMAWNY